jgi:hypothetical protein
MIFVATKKRQKFFYPSLLLLFLDPGSGMEKNQDSGSWIRDKHTGTGSATLDSK